MTTLWDSIKKGLTDSAKLAKEGATIAAEKAEEFGKKGKVTIDISRINRKIEQQFTELGGKVYHLMAEENKKNLASNEEVKQYIDAINQLEDELKAKKLEREKIGAENADKEVVVEEKAEDAPEAGSNGEDKTE